MKGMQFPPLSDQPQQGSVAQPKQFGWLRNGYEWLAERLWMQSELKVTQKHDRHGATVWEIYDSFSGQCIVLDSEAEARRWVETQRYHKIVRNDVPSADVWLCSAKYRR